MGNLQDAADHIHALAAKYEPLVRVSELLKQVGSIDGHLAELEIKRADALSAIEQLKVDHEELKAVQAAELAAAEARVVAINEQAARLETATNQRIQELFVAGEAEAIAKAEALYNERASGIADLDAQYASKSAQLAELTNEVSVMEAEKIRVAAETVAAQAGLAEVIATIERLSKFGSAPNA